MKIRIGLFLTSLCMAALLVPPAYAAKGIESEPLPPPPGQQGTSGKPITPSTTIPMTPRSGSVTPSSPTSSDSDDSGMSGTTGGTSAYDLGTSKTPVPVTPAPSSVPSTTTSAPISSAPVVITPAGQPLPEPVEPAAHSITPIIDTGVAPKDDPRLENKKFCTLKVSFGSIGTGVDGKTGTAIKSYLDAHADKITYTRANWGREGEYTYCLDIPEHRNRATTYRELKRLLPAKGTNGPYTELSGEGFTSVTTAR